MSDYQQPDKFADMRVISSPPSLFLVNGCGTTVYGSRDYDAETGTYVKTQCVCVVFVPILAIAAYRVSDAGNGWTFYGRVPLSRFARWWNCLLLLGVLGLCGYGFWSSHTSSPEYIAERRLEEADRLAAEGQLVPAAEIFRDVLQGGSKRSSEGGVKLRELLDGPVQQAPPAVAAAVLKIAVDANSQLGMNNLYEYGLRLAQRHADADPRGALVLLDTVAALAPDAKALTAEQEKLLARAVVKEPAEPEFASRLAVIFEERGERAKCKDLLLPHVRRLGKTEGARILGHLLAEQGDLEAAHALLLPYAEGRLEQLHNAEAALETAFNAAQQGVINELQQGTAAGFDYDGYRAADKKEKDRLIGEYINTRLKDDESIRTAQEAVRRESVVVPVALDLGMVILRRAQAMPDPAARKAELEKAEKTFLAVRGLAGESAAYQLSLGQVYYWLGKHTEGRKLLDEHLTAQQRAHASLLNVSGVLREVGATSEARALAEEAYAKAASDNEKHGAAMQRALMWIDVDDEILWLRRTNQDQLEARASLSSALGKRAMQDGKDADAARHFRDAIEVHERLPRSASTLNNGALCYLSLYYVTGERDAAEKGIEMLDSAVKLRPSDSILLSNAGYTILETALRDLVGSSIDLRTLKANAGFELLPFLYQDQAGRDKLRQRFREHAGIRKAVDYLNRVQLLSPKRHSTYDLLQRIHTFSGDAEALRLLARRMEEVDLDLTDSIRATLDLYAGKDMEKQRGEMKSALDRFVPVVGSARQGGQGPTFAYAACRLALTQMGHVALGGPGNADEIVALAAEAHKAAPSSGTNSTLTAALLHRAHETLSAKEPAYAALTAKSRRALAPQYLVALALGSKGVARTAALENKDVRSALALLREAGNRFPSDGNEWAWAVLRADSADDAARMAKAIQQDEVGRLDLAIELRLSPVSGAIALRAFWGCEVAGTPEKGLAILKACAERGTPIPVGQPE